MNEVYFENINKESNGLPLPQEGKHTTVEGGVS